MTQTEIDAAVSQATGEDHRQVRQRGFSIADPDEVNFDPEPDQLPPNIIDWDELDLLHNCTWSSQRTRERNQLTYA